MLKTRVQADYTIRIPEPLRPALEVGDEVLITQDEAGRIIITPQARVRAILERTAGMWRGRKDIPEDGVTYVQNLRQSRRLRDLGLTPDGD